MKNDKKVLVVKYGSKCVVDEFGLDQERINEYARKVAILRETYDVLVVASGSVAAGKRFWQEHDPTIELSDAQILASIGSAGASEAWRQGFQKQGVMVGQVLVTHREIEDEKEGDSLISALQKLFAHGVIAIVNENDVLSDKELKQLAYGGDNDGLASHLAIRLEAEAVLFLTDVDGFMENEMVKQRVSLSEIEGLQHHLLKANDEGTGSMRSKLDAAAKATIADTRAFIANAETQSYSQILDGSAGTELVK